MKQSDRAILMGVGVVALMAAFWFLILAPKRQEASKLGDEIATLESEIADQEQMIALAVDAREGYKQRYKDLIVLGKAAPADSDTPSLITQLQGMADRSKVAFGTLQLGSDTSAAAPPAAPAAPPAEGEEAETGEETAETAAVPTEAATSTLPLGASVGPAGLPVMPYSVQISGGFFETAKFLAEIDSLVSHRNGKFEIDGRLFTVNGFSMTTPQSSDGNDSVLEITLDLTTYLVPDSEGVSGGATPTAPAPVAPEATTASAPVEPAS